VKCSGIISTFLLFFLTSESFAQDYTATVLDNIRSDYEMVYVSGGTFLMGDLFFQFNQESLPVHRVQVHDFYIGKYHVTFDQYDSFAKLKNLPIPDDRRFGRGSRAVVNVTWNEALAFCRALGFRLPTEQEWEYAARSGGRDELFAGTSNRDSLNYFAHFQFNSPPISQAVGTKLPNGLGNYDMSGNVFDWIGEWYEFYNVLPEYRIYKSPDETDLRIIRGGSVKQLPFPIRTYWRTKTLHYNRGNDIGFRCASLGKTQK
jgi:formylglycine-generating enzyme